MRKSELMAFTWLDFKENSFSITKTYTKKTKDGGWKITSPNIYTRCALPEKLIKQLNALKMAKNAKDTDYIWGNELPTNERRIDLARD